MTERAKISSEHRAKRNQPAPDQASTGSRKRNTKRWCRGKVGQEHDYQPVIKEWHWNNRIFKNRFLKCSKCGREEWRGK